jgi:hypothetical protein
VSVTVQDLFLALRAMRRPDIAQFIEDRMQDYPQFCAEEGRTWPSLRLACGGCMHWGEVREHESLAQLEDLFYLPGVWEKAEMALKDLEEARGRDSATRG